MDDGSYKRARHRVEELKGFYLHLMIYVLVNIVLFLLNVLRTPDQYWFQYSLLGWGIGLAAHAVGVFGVGWVFGRKWEESKIQQLVEREKAREEGP